MRSQHSISLAAARRAPFVAIVSRAKTGERQDRNKNTMSQMSTHTKNTPSHSGGHNRGGMKWSVIRVCSHAPPFNIPLTHTHIYIECILSYCFLYFCQWNIKLMLSLFPHETIPAPSLSSLPACGWHIKRQFPANFLLDWTRQRQRQQINSIKAGDEYEHRGNQVICIHIKTLKVNLHRNF